MGNIDWIIDMIEAFENKTDYEEGKSKLHMNIYMTGQLKMLKMLIT